jgi:TolB-like protein
MQSGKHITLAILPFEDFSPREELRIFCRSFSEDLSTELSRFRQFRMIRLSAQDSRMTSSDELVDALPTDYFVQGTFRFEKEIVLINVQLYNGRTRHLVWGNRFEGTLPELSDMQNHLLAAVTGVLQQQINSDLLSGLRKRPSVEFRAYEHWLYGMEEVKKGSVENDLVAREHFEKALEIQPDYALAFTGLSLTYFNEWSCQLYDRWDVSKTGAYEWAQKAIELDDQNHIAAMVLGRIFIYEGSYSTGEYYLRKSLLLNPNDPDTLIQIAMAFAYMGLGDEAIDLYEKTMQLNPFNADKYFTGGFLIHFELGNYEEASGLILQPQKIKTANAEAYFAAIYYYLQQYDQMHKEWKKFLDTYRKLISKGKDFTPQEAVDWIMKINPYKHKTNLEPFLRYITNDVVETSTAPKIHGYQKSGDNYFVKDTVAWKLSYEGMLVNIPELKGLYDIQKMLMEPRYQFHCAELMESKLDGNGVKVLDEKARKQYQRKLVDLKSEMHEAEQFSDFTRLEKLQEEYDQLITHLSQSLGLQGKARKTGSTVEKARSAVTWRIRNAIARIEQDHPLLGAHLSNAIKTGILCSYQPDRELMWITS